MKTALVLCCLLAAAAAAPQGNRFFPNRFQPSTATGAADVQVVTGTNTGPAGISNINQVSASAGGQVTGTGTSSSGGFGSVTSLQSQFGNSQQVQTNVFSNQSTQQSRRPCSGRRCIFGK